MGIDEKYDIYIQGISDGEYYPLANIAEMNIDATKSATLCGNMVPEKEPPS